MTAARFARPHFPTSYLVQLVAGLAQVWGKISAPRAVRSHRAQLCMHSKAGTSSHGRAPARGCGDLPHWRGAICPKHDQCQFMPHRTEFEAIPGAGRRVLLSNRGCTCLIWRETRNAYFPRWAPLWHQKTCSALVSAEVRVLAAFETIGSSSALWGAGLRAGNRCHAESSVSAGAAGAE